MKSVKLEKIHKAIKIRKGEYENISESLLENADIGTCVNIWQFSIYM